MLVIRAAAAEEKGPPQHDIHLLTCLYQERCAALLSLLQQHELPAGAVPELRLPARDLRAFRLHAHHSPASQLLPQDLCIQLLPTQQLLAIRWHLQLHGYLQLVL